MEPTDLWLDVMSELVDLPIPAEAREDVKQQLALIHLLARPLLDMELPEACMPAPVFKP